MARSRKFIVGFIATIILLPIMAFASTEYKGTETVNINKANAETLAAYLNGIGASKAEAIVAYRKSNGNFESLTDLKEVPGIGEQTYKNLKSKISTSKGKTTAPEGYKLSETKKTSTTTKSSSSTAASKKTTSDSSSKDKSSKTTASKSKSTASKASKSKSTESKASKSKSKATESKTSSKKTSQSKKLVEEKKKS